MANLSTEAADLKKTLKACKKAVTATTVPRSKCANTTAMNTTRDRVQSAMATLINKQELGESLAMAAEFALRFKKTMDRQQLDATTIEPLLVDIRSAVFDITAASIFLKHECEKA